MNNDLNVKLAKLREVYKLPEDQRDIDDLEKALRKKIVQSELSDHPVILDLIENAVKRISEINVLLAYDKEYNADTVESRAIRQRIFAERSAHEFWLSRFDPRAASRAVERLEKFVDKRLQEN